MVCLSPDGRARKSKLAERFALRSADEAAAYLEHAVLGPRLLRCVEAVLALQVVATDEIFGHPDDLKFKSSMTYSRLLVRMARHSTRYSIMAETRKP